MNYHPLILVDSGILFAYYSARDKYHHQVRAFFESCTSRLLTVPGCITEVMDVNQGRKNQRVQSITLRSHVGPDGILHLDVPVGLADAELEVTVTIQTVTPPKAKTPEELGYLPGFFERTAGCFQDEPLVRYPQGETQERNWDDLSKPS